MQTSQVLLTVFTRRTLLPWLSISHTAAAAAAAERLFLLSKQGLCTSGIVWYDARL